MAFTLIAFILMLVIVGVGAFAIFRAFRWQNRQALFFSLGCVSLILIPTLICGISSWVKASSKNPYHLPRKDALSFNQYDNIDDVTIGVDFYTQKGINEILFQGDSALYAFPSGLIVIELIASNESENQIEINRSDLKLKYEGQNTNARVVDYHTALQHLESFEATLIGPGLPHEICLLSPLVLGFAPRDYLTIRRWMDTLSENEFEYGQVAPSETTHGLVYFEIDTYPFIKNHASSAFDSSHNWGLEITTHHSSGDTTLHDFSW